MKITHLFACAILLTAAVHSFAADAYLVRFRATGHSDASGSVLWSDDVLLFNRNSQTVATTFLGVSNGSIVAGAPPQLLLPSGRPISLNEAIGDRWDPSPATDLWVLHLDVPSGVVVESRDEYYFVSSSALSLPPQPLGKVSMPVFRSLMPAGEAQVHLGTDLSGNDSRINVGVFNADATPAVVSIEVRRTCDDAVMDSRTVAVPANTIVQIGGLMRGDGGCDPFGWRRYTVVTSSQQGISYVANLNDGAPTQPGLGTIAPVVFLAVTQNAAF